VEGRLPPRTRGGVLSQGGVVVAGGGLAGSRTCAELRAAGYGGPLVLLCAEDHEPYDRPPLSKGVLLGHVEGIFLDHLDGLDVDVRLGVAARALHGREVDLADGTTVAFDHLVVATGALPVSLPGSGPQTYLRTVDDAKTLRAALTSGASLLVVGAGWIGAEVATAARTLGCEVTVVEAGEAPLAAGLGAEVGALTVPWWTHAGVALRTRCAVTAVESGGVVLGDGSRLEAEVVLTAVGVRPATGWLAGSDVVVDRGVVVDAGLRSSRPDVLAVGDAAAWWSPRLGRRVTLEHWDDALRAPAAVASSILGIAATHDPVPYVWSEQFGRYLQLVGLPGPQDRVVTRGDLAGPPGDPGSAVCWLDASGRLTAVLAVDRPRDLAQGRKLVEARSVVDPDLVADVARPLRDCVA
jgi:3-phenylpropionate/trans-cinnamate dioxygenase ferredoxin reductase subunit